MQKVCNPSGADKNQSLRTISFAVKPAGASLVRRSPTSASLMRRSPTSASLSRSSTGASPVPRSPTIASLLPSSLDAAQSSTGASPSTTASAVWTIKSSSWREAAQRKERSSPPWEEPREREARPRGAKDPPRPDKAERTERSQTDREHRPVSERTEEGEGSGYGERVASSPGEGQARAEGDRTKRPSRVERQKTARSKRMPPTLDLQLVSRTPDVERALEPQHGRSASPGGGGPARSDAAMVVVVSELQARVYELEARAVKAETELEWATIDALRERGTRMQNKREKRRAAAGEGRDKTGCVGGLALIPRRKSLKKAGMVKANAGLEAPAAEGKSLKRGFFTGNKRGPCFEALSKGLRGNEGNGSGTYVKDGERDDGDNSGNNETVPHKNVLRRMSTVMNMNARAGMSMLRAQESSRDKSGIEDVPEAPDAPPVFFGVKGSRSELKKKVGMSGY